MIKILLKILRYFKETSIKKIFSPFEGNVVPSYLLADVTLTKDIIGPSLGVLPYSDVVKSPCTAIVKKISKNNNALILQVGKVDLIINVGINRKKYEKSLFHLNVEEGIAVSKGQVLMTFDLQKLCELDRNFVCVLTVRHNKVSRYFSFVNARHVDFSTVLCILKVI